MLLEYTLKRMRRSLPPCLAIVGITAALTLTLSWLGVMAECQIEQMNAVYDNVEIRCVVSDLRGVTDGLNITNSYIHLVTRPEYEFPVFVKNPYIKRTLTYTMELDGGKLVGLNDVRADMRLSLERGIRVSYAEGYSEASFSEDGLIVWAHEEWLAEHGLAPEDYVTLTVTDPRKEMWEGSDGEVEESFLIAGSFNGAVTDTLYIPLKTAHELAAQACNTYEWADSISFAVADNRELNRFREVAAKFYTTVDVSATYDPVYQWALTVHDGQFRQALVSAQKSVRMFEVLTPLYYLIASVIGLLVCYLFTRNRRREFFLFRCAGLKPLPVIYSAVFEQLALALTGIALGTGLSIVFQMYLGEVWSLGPLICGLLAGAALSVVLNVRSGLLSYKEE